MIVNKTLSSFFKVPFPLTSSHSKRVPQTLVFYDVLGFFSSPDQSHAASKRR